MRAIFVQPAPFSQKATSPFLGPRVLGERDIDLPQCLDASILHIWGQKSSLSHCGVLVSSCLVGTQWAKLKFTAEPLFPPLGRSVRRPNRMLQLCRFPFLPAGRPQAQIRGQVTQGRDPAFWRSLQKRALTFYGPWAQLEGGGRARSGAKLSQREERWLGPGPW